MKLGRADVVSAPARENAMGESRRYVLKVISTGIGPS